MRQLGGHGASAHPCFLEMTKSITSPNVEFSSPAHIFTKMDSLYDCA